MHKGFGERRRFTLNAIREQLHLQSPDIVCLQEVQGEHSKKKIKISNWPIEPQLQFLAGQHWPHYIYAKNAVYRKGHHGNGILSKHTVVEWENINIAVAKSMSRSLLHTRLMLADSDKPLHIICAHLGLFEAERERQFSALSDRIEAHVPHDEPLVIAGDFNDWRKRAAQHLADHLDLREAFQQQHGVHAKTFPAKYPTLSVDRIYYRGLSLCHCQRLRTLAWKGLSDHIPLLAEFSLN